MAWVKKAQVNEHVQHLKSFSNIALKEFDQLVNILKHLNIPIDQTNDAIWQVAQNLHGALTILYNEAQGLDEGLLMAQGQQEGGRPNFVAWQTHNIRLALQSLLRAKEAEHLTSEQKELIQSMIDDLDHVTVTEPVAATAADVSETPSILDPEQQGLTEDEEIRLQEIRIDTYSEGPGEVDDDNNEAALSVKVSNGTVEIVEWDKMSPPDDPAQTAAYEANPILRRHLSMSLQDLIEGGEKTRGHYSGDLGWSLKEILALPDDDQGLAIISIAVSAISYGADREKYVSKLGE